MGDWAQRVKHVKRQQEGDHLQTTERGLRGKQPAGTLILDLQPLRTRTEEMNFSCFSHPVYGILQPQPTTTVAFHPRGL